MSTLTETDAQKLFNEVSQSIRSNDTIKLDELIDVKPVEGNPESVETVPAVEPEVETDTTQETPTSETGTQETPPPPSQAENQPTELEVKTPEELATLKAQLETMKKENHHLKSQAGRMPHMQSRLKELDKKLEQLQKQVSSPSSRPSAKIKPELEKKLAKLRESDAELADIIEAAASTASDGTANELLNAEISHVEAQRKEEYEAYHKAQWELLVEEVNNAADIFKDKHWSEWKAGQNKAWQALASSDEASDVIFAIRRYEQDMIAKFPELAPKVETPKVEQANSEAAIKAQQVEAARQHRQQGSVTPGPQAVAVATPTPSDAASLFKKFSEEIRKDRLG